MSQLAVTNRSRKLSGGMTEKFLPWKTTDLSLCSAFFRILKGTSVSMIPTNSTSSARTPSGWLVPAIPP